MPVLQKTANALMEHENKSYAILGLLVDVEVEIDGHVAVPTVCIIFMIHLLLKNIRLTVNCNPNILPGTINPWETVIIDEMIDQILTTLVAH